MTLPLVTIGVVSYNRLHYLKALMASARVCVRYEPVQWIVVDGGSTEPGLREYVEGLDFVDEKLFRRCTQAEAMNEIVGRAAGECLLMLPEDVQFVVRGTWLADMAELVLTHPEVGHVQFDAQRRKTLRRHFDERPILIRGRPVPFSRSRPRRLRTTSGAEFLGYGHVRDPAGAAGIVTFVRTELRRALGPWRTNAELTSGEDSGLGAEADMIERYRRSGLRLESFLMRHPAAADVVTDPRGTKARIRCGNRRYGRYRPPQHDLYYRILDEEELGRFDERDVTPSFEDIVEPLGFDLPFDEEGNLMKTSVITANEPYELVDR